MRVPTSILQEGKSLLPQSHHLSSSYIKQRSPDIHKKFRLRQQSKTPGFNFCSSLPIFVIKINDTHGTHSMKKENKEFCNRIWNCKETTKKPVPES